MCGDILVVRMAGRAGRKVVLYWHLVGKGYVQYPLVPRTVPTMKNFPAKNNDVFVKICNRSLESIMKSRLLRKRTHWIVLSRECLKGTSAPGLTFSCEQTEGGRNQKQEDKTGGYCKVQVRDGSSLDQG